MKSDPLLPLPLNKFKYYQSLKFKKYREREKKFIIEGIKICEEAFHSNYRIDSLLLHSQRVSPEMIRYFKKICDQQNIACYDLAHHKLSALADTVHSQGVIGIVNDSEPHIDPDQFKFIVAIDGAQDPGNVGTVIRTADWFGVNAILLGEGAVDVYNSKVLRSSMGSIFHLPILSHVDLSQFLGQLKKSGYRIYIASVHGDRIYDDEIFSEKRVLVIGHETRGISPSVFDLADVTMKIPAKGQAESLNMAVATGIMLSRMVNHE